MDVRTGTKVAEVNVDRQSLSKRLSADIYEDYLAAGTSDGHCLIFDWRRPQEVLEDIPAHVDSGGPTAFVDLDRFRLVTASSSYSPGRVRGTGFLAPAPCFSSIGGERAMCCFASPQDPIKVFDPNSNYDLVHSLASVCTEQEVEVPGSMVMPGAYGLSALSVSGPLLCSSSTHGHVVIRDFDLGASPVAQSEWSASRTGSKFWEGPPDFSSEDDGFSSDEDEGH